MFLPIPCMARAVPAPLNVAVGAALRRASEAADIKHEALADLLWVSRSQLNQWFLGCGNVPLNRLMLLTRDEDGRRLLACLEPEIAALWGLDEIDWLFGRLHRLALAVAKRKQLKADTQRQQERRTA
jgi:DNA-binding transcriptional regulator YdaS (Cro superfamily)